MQHEIQQVVNEFRAWPELNGIAKGTEFIRVESLPAPHRSGMLPTGWQGVYNFQLGDSWFKSGKAGPNSGARWLSYHYSPGRAMSRLAGSLLLYAREAADDPRLPSNLRLPLQGVTLDGIGPWIKANTARHNILIKSTLGNAALSRLEAIAHAILKPIFEGRRSGH
ncbi:MAG: hypothetical protein EXR78_09840 [Deltaproteobacteria bacterium]|nr:hypothetical protein [Deltaproteobacteria bacterium]